MAEKSYFIANLQEQIADLVVEHSVVLTTENPSSIQEGLEGVLLGWRGAGRWADEVVKNHVITAMNTGLRSTSCRPITPADAAGLAGYIKFLEV